MMVVGTGRQGLCGGVIRLCWNPTGKGLESVPEDYLPFVLRKRVEYAKLLALCCGGSMLGAFLVAVVRGHLSHGNGVAIFKFNCVGFLGLALFGLLGLGQLHILSKYD